MNRKWCAYSGCNSHGKRWDTERHFAAHLATSHSRCSCGWVGVRQSIHLAQRVRRGDAYSDHVETPIPALPVAREVGEFWQQHDAAILAEGNELTGQTWKCRRRDVVSVR